MMERATACDVDPSSVGNLGSGKEPIIFVQAPGDSCDHGFSAPKGLMPLDSSAGSHRGEGFIRGPDPNHRLIERHPLGGVWERRAILGRAGENPECAWDAQIISGSCVANARARCLRMLVMKYSPAR